MVKNPAAMQETPLLQEERTGRTRRGLEDRTGHLPRLLCPPQEAVPSVWSESSPSTAGPPAPCLRHKVGLKKCLGDEPKEA